MVFTNRSLKALPGLLQITFHHLTFIPTHLREGYYSPSRSPSRCPNLVFCENPSINYVRLRREDGYYFPHFYTSTIPYWRLHPPYLQASHYTKECSYGQSRHLAAGLAPCRCLAEYSYPRTSLQRLSLTSWDARLWRHHRWLHLRTSAFTTF